MGGDESYFDIISLIVDAFSVKKVNSYVRSTGSSVHRAALVSSISKTQLISYFPVIQST